MAEIGSGEREEAFVGEKVESRELDEAQMVAWGEAIGQAVTPPLALTLSGDLGTGKTTLARAIARGAGLRAPIPSPTYNLMFRYPTGRGFDLVHIDLYRLEREDDVWALGWSELPGENEVVVIEWPERARSILPEPRWQVRLEESADPDRRRVSISRIGDAIPIPIPEPV